MEETGSDTAKQSVEAKKEGSVKPAELPPLDFSTFILSLSSSVLMNLGVVENPVTNKKEKEPAIARQTIDLMVLLQEKTKGNLTESEAKLMEEVLHELQLWYVKTVA